MSVKSLIINPGSTSTKLGIFTDETLEMDETLRHSTEEIAQYDSIIAQKDFRKKIILDFLADKNIDVKSFDVIVGRGGMLKPIPGGTYTVTDALEHDLTIGVQGQHASNLGGILAREIGDEIGVPSYIVDPVVVDELCDAARLSGLPEIPRVSVFHALNQKAVCRRYAAEVGRKYEELNLIGVHLGGGVSVAAHEKGRVIDVFNALDGDGAFSPERAGALPVGGLIRLCFSGKVTEKEMMKRAVGGGGFNAYLNTNDAREVMKMIDEGNQDAKLMMDAFVFQLSKNVGSMAAVLAGRVDQIIITGGIAHNQWVTDEITKRVSFIAPVTVYPGEDELLALAQGALRVMNGEEQAKIYEEI
ncbi:MAG: butyrate kinase [Lachnospiraceae bacterium]|nr:butyrate kinase [Lachnospiraceae bacterium]